MGRKPEKPPRTWPETVVGRWLPFVLFWGGCLVGSLMAYPVGRYPWWLLLLPWVAAFALMSTTPAIGRVIDRRARRRHDHRQRDGTIEVAASRNPTISRPDGCEARGAAVAEPRDAASHPRDNADDHVCRVTSTD